MRNEMMKKGINVDDRVCRGITPLMNTKYITKTGSLGYLFKNGFQLAREGKEGKYRVNAKKSAGDALIHIERMSQGSGSQNLEGCSYVSRMSMKMCSTCCCKKGPVVLDVKSASCESGDSPLCQNVPKLKKPAADCEVWFSMVDAFVRFAANWHAVQQTYML